MQVRFHKNFTKQFKKQNFKLRYKIIEVIDKFMKNPFDKSLENHRLKGKLKGMRAFSITRDIRIIFEERDNYMMVIMLDIGTHNRVY